MVMATQTVPPSLPVGNRSVVLWTLTRQKAIKAIQEQLRAQGERLSYIPIRDIRVFADAYFAEHRRELIEVTKAIVSESPEQLKLDKRRLCMPKSGVQSEPYTIDRRPNWLTCPESASTKNACPFGPAGYPKSPARHGS
jgi:hypothetical protein